MARKILLPLLALALAILACNVPAGTTVPPTDTPAPGTVTDTPAPGPSDTPGPGPSITPPPPSGSGGLTLDLLRNGTYHAPFYDRTITLVNGEFSDGAGYSVHMGAVYAFGDLNGDHNDDAAIILAENGGGSGTFESVVAVSLQSGAAHQIGQAELGDRVLVSAADISSGVIHLDMMVQGPSDPFCCPSLPEKQNYWMIGNTLWLMRLTSTVSGLERSINISSPGNWVHVDNPFTVNGSASYLPFENTLGYKVYLIDGTVVNESSVTVNASSMFSKAFDFSSAGISDFVIIQFADYSAADGSLVALGSVILDMR